MTVYQMNNNYAIISRQINVTTVSNYSVYNSLIYTIIPKFLRPIPVKLGITKFINSLATIYNYLFLVNY